MTGPQAGFTDAYVVPDGHSGFYRGPATAGALPKSGVAPGSQQKGEFLSSQLQLKRLRQCKKICNDERVWVFKTSQRHILCACVEVTANGLKPRLVSLKKS